MLQLVGIAAIAIPVLVTSQAEEKMARRLASEVVKAIEGDVRFTLSQQRSSGSLDISLPARVGWSRRLDWTEISYQARLISPDGRTRVVAGRCWNWNLKACARQIVDGAAQFDDERSSSAPKFSSVNGDAAGHLQMECRAAAGSISSPESTRMIFDNRPAKP